jgi:hypothetical protein
MDADLAAQYLKKKTLQRIVNSIAGISPRRMIEEAAMPWRSVFGDG